MRGTNTKRLRAEAYSIQSGSNHVFRVQVMLGPQQAVGQPAHRCALPSDLRWNGPQRCNVIVERDLAQRSQPTLEACINGSPLGCNLLRHRLLIWMSNSLRQLSMWHLPSHRRFSFFFASSVQRFREWVGARAGHVTSVAELVRAIAVGQESPYIEAPLQEALRTLLVGRPAAVATPARLCSPHRGPARPALRRRKPASTTQLC